MLYFAPWKTVLIALIAVLGVIFAAPNFVSRDLASAIPEWLPHRQINLGLDLQGGSHLLLEVDVDTLIHERLEDLEDGVRAALRGERIGYRGLGVSGDGVRVTIRDPAEVKAALAQLEELNSQIGAGILGGSGPSTELDISVHDGQSVVLALTEAAVEARKRSAVEQSIEIVRRRVDETGTREPTIQRQGADRILVQLPGEQDPDRIKRLLGKTAKLVFRLIDTSLSPIDAERKRVPQGSELLPSDAELDGSGESIKYLVRKRVMVSGDTLVNAQATTDQQTGQPVVSFRFDAIGAKRFADVTKENVGRPFAIVLDGEVVSAPVIREPILGGSGQISGRFTFQEVNDLAILLRAGALPAPLTILEERTVGPDLGADSVAQGKIAAVIGFVLVIIFMAAAYGAFGLIADLSLVINMLLIGGVLSLLQATLTLPGIAGIVLTIGMAVDANVLIFERIKEEVLTGKTPFAAVDAGYKRALTTIIDANVTTFIAAFILWALGSGPVKGFAVTLGIGIATSMFTAIILSRLLVVTWLRRRRPALLPL